MDVLLPEWADGSYRVIVVTDRNGQVFEQNREANNHGTSTTLVLGHPDLAVTGVNAPATATSASSFQVSWTVVNAGSRPVAGTWTDRVYLTPDGVIDGDARLLASVQRTGPVTDGYTGSAEVTLPIDTRGDWQIVVVTDATGTVLETNAENNNRASSSIAIALAPYADLRSRASPRPLDHRRPGVRDHRLDGHQRRHGCRPHERLGRRVIVSTNDVAGDGDDRVWRRSCTRAASRRTRPTRRVASSCCRPSPAATSCSCAATRPVSCSRTTRNSTTRAKAGNRST